MDRRTFHHYLGLAIPSLFLWQAEMRKKRIFPRALRQGDTVGLITPGSYLSDEGLEKAIQNVKSLGLKVKLGKHIRARRGFNAGTDAQRLQDLHAMFADNEVKAVWAARGGYGCSRLLPQINYQLIRKNPKVLIGYSDITALLNAIHHKTGLVGFHGPVGASDFTPYTVAQLEALLMSTNKDYVIHPAVEQKENPDSAYQLTTIKSGEAEGVLIGGNLSLLAAMAGTGYLPSLKNKILFLEEIGEKPYRVDRMLTQLRQAWPLHEAEAIICGVFADCAPDEGDHSLSLLETIEDRLGDLGLPLVYGLSFGHIDPQCTLPVGVKARINSDTHKITLLESAVLA
jgi:muramoyltetrapeptide carboxypeptidase